MDSDEEIRRMVAAQDATHVALRQEVDEDNLEVVGLDYLAKSDRSCHQHNGNSHTLKTYCLFLFFSTHELQNSIIRKIGFET